MPPDQPPAGDEKFILDVVEWQGKLHCIYLNGFRIVGPKPWGGGTTAKRFYVTKADIEEALRMPVKA